MEILILVALFIYLIIANSNLSSKLRDLEDQFSNLHKKINELKNTTVNSAATQEFSSTKEEIKSPKPTMPVIEIGEQFKPTVEIPVSKPVVENTTEKVVFSMDNIQNPKPQPKPYVPQKSFWESFKEKIPI